MGELNKGERANLISEVASSYRIRLADGTEGFVSKAWTTRVRPAPVSPSVAGDVPFKVHFLDVGTGDAAIIDIGTAEIIIDGGDSETVLRNYVRQRAIIDGPVELVVVTHVTRITGKG